MEIKSYIWPYRKGLTLPFYADVPLYRRTRYDGYYGKLGIVVRGHRVYALSLERSKDRYGYSLGVPQHHQLLHVAASKNMTAVFHTDGDKLYVTMRDGKDIRTLDIGNPSEVRTFDSGMAIKQRTGTWLLVPAVLPEISNGWLSSKSGQDFKSRLRDKTVVIPKDSTPIFMRFVRPLDQILSNIPVGMLITDDGKIHFISIGRLDPKLEVDLGNILETKAGDAVKALQGIKNIHTTLERYAWTFQFDDEPIYMYAYDDENRSYVLKTVSDSGRLLDSENIPAIQTPDNKLIIGGHKFDLPQSTEISDLAWADSVDVYNKDIIMIDNNGHFHTVNLDGRPVSPRPIQSFREKILDLVTHQYPGLQDSVATLLRDANYLLSFLKMC